jgi:TPR repeat protein
MKKYYLQTIDKGGCAASMNNLGYYYQCEEMDYALAKKYYLQAIEKGNTNAMNNLGQYYKWMEGDCDNAKKYFLQATEKGDAVAMYNLGYNFYHEKNYDLMKKYYLMAIDKGREAFREASHEAAGDAMEGLGKYYEKIKINYKLMTKYYLMAVSEGNTTPIERLDYYYMRNIPSYDDLRNYLLALIRGPLYIRDSDLFNKYINKSLEYQKVSLFCEFLNTHKLRIYNFEVCVLKIINFINKFQYSKLKNINYFMKSISKIYYCVNKIKYRNEYQKECQKECKNEYRNERRICLQNILNTNTQTSQLFMEYLDYYYYKYLEKIYKPGSGSGYIKTKKHFEMTIANAIKNKNKI